MSNKLTAFIFVIALLTFILAQDCRNAAETDCGASGSNCQYYQWFNGTCTPPTSCPNQTVWSNSSFNCVSCMGSDSVTCSSCQPALYFFDNQEGFCSTCQASYGSLCTTCNSTQCKTCESGYILTSGGQSCFNNTCLATNCITCANNLTCATCDINFKVFNGLCVCSIFNCQVCSSSTCSKCFNGYSISSDRLSCNIICINNCASCTNLNSCTRCATGYTYRSGTNQCVIDCTLINTFCTSCSSTSLCTSCSTNYTLTNSGSCQLACTNPYCVQCSISDRSTCTSCLTGYKVSNGTCTLDFCNIKNCAICYNSNTCEQCASFFSLTTNQTSCEPSCGITNCLVCSSSISCKTCNDGFKLLGGACTKLCSITNCDTCSTENTCSKCNAGTTLSLSKLTCDYNCGISGCANCGSSTACSQCYPGYTLTSGNCIVNCVQGTYRSSSTNTCVACSSNCRRCDTNGKCLHCRDRFYINFSTLTCIACSTISNCFNCEPGTGQCTSCNAGFSLENKACVLKNTCAVSNCFNCVTGNPAKCQTCESGYIKSDADLCVKIACPSPQFLSGSTCTCGERAYFFNSQCNACPDRNCVSCTISTCISCTQGYYAGSGQTCTACSNKCKTCDANGCSECLNNFVLKDKACQPPATSEGKVSQTRNGIPAVCSAGCNSCDFDSSNNLVCLEAKQGYILSQGFLYRCSDSCRTCLDTPDSKGKYSECLSCYNGKIAISGSCNACTGSNARTCRQNDLAYAITCQPGYTVVNGVCRACALDCLKCDSSGQGLCDRSGCKTGFFQTVQFSSCVKCFDGCLVCGSDPNVCDKCGDYYFLNPSTKKCASCPSNCIICSSATVCTVCKSGYLAASDGTCKIPSVKNCVTYDSNINCTQCDFGYTLSSNTCTSSIACNSNSACITCPYNYYLSSGKCLICPAITNCQSCDKQDQTKCLQCSVGYYLSAAGTCLKCSTGCQSCTSSINCNSASSGYYLLETIAGETTGAVSQCAGLCQTCLHSELQCLTCKANAYLVGNQCIGVSNYALSIIGFVKALGSTQDVANSAPANSQLGNAVNTYPRLIDQISKALGFTSFGLFSQNSVVRSLQHKSVEVQFLVNSDQVATDPKTALANYQYTDIGFMSATAVGPSVENTNSTRLGLVLGVSIPLGILLILVIVLIKTKLKDDDEEEEDYTEKDLDHNGQFV